MYERALVALDLSPAEQPILDCLPALQSWGVRHMILTHVIQFGYGQGAGLAHQQEYEDWLEACAEPIRAAGLSVEIQVRTSGVPADEIQAAARDAGADLVVIGSRGQNLLSRLFLGSVARQVIRKTTLPLLLEWIEPGADETAARCQAVCTDTLRHVLLATDFSAQGEAAENAAVALAPRTQQLQCVHVLADDAMLSESAARAALTRLVERIAAAGGRADGALLTGKPSAEIARHAAEQDASLILLGKHGRSWVASRTIGSTATNLCEIAGRPVLMIPAFR
ncbi:MAG: universal stress protein [Pseudomonadales bacterium]